MSFVMVGVCMDSNLYEYAVVVGVKGLGRLWGFYIWYVFVVVAF